MSTRNLVALGVMLLIGFVAFAQDSVLPPGQEPVIVEPFPRSQVITTIVPPRRLAVDLEVVGSSIGRKFYVLWNDGNVTTAIPEALRVEGDCPADINGDGKVGVADLVILNAEWGTDCP